MPQDIHEKKDRLSDEELNRVLVQWAEGEVPLPEDFHPEVMAKLRKLGASQQEEKAVPFFLKNKKWLSVAAAAVFAMICIPVVQTQFGDDPTDSVVQEKPVQQIASSDNGTERVQEKDKENPMVIPSLHEDRRESYGDALEYQEGGHSIEIGRPNQGEDVLIPEEETEQGQPELKPEEPSEPEKPEKPETEPEKPKPRPSLSMPAFPLTSAFESGNNGLYANENNNQAMFQTYQSAIRKVDQELGTLHGELKECDKKIAAFPQDVSLQEERKKIVSRIEALEKERKQINRMIAELR